MGSLAGKTPKETYKSLLKVADESNGVTTAHSQIEDGEGTSTCASISDDILSIQPQNDNTTTTFRVKNKASQDILTADTTNGVVKAGTSQTNVSTNIIEFAMNESGAPTAGTHYFIPVVGTNAGSGNARIIANGTGADPDTSFGMSTFAQRYLQFVWKVPLDITIDAINVLSGCAGSSAVSMNYHLYSFAISNDNDTDDGNLSDGTLISALTTTNTNNTVVKQGAGIISSANVDANRCLAFFAENSTNTEIFSVRATIIYHFR